MSRLQMILAGTILAGGIFFSQLASAQYPGLQTAPMSPWMGLWQKNTGALDNYHTFVLPQMQLDRTLQMQNAAMTRQAAGLQDLSAIVSQSQANPSKMMPTGQGATFMDYSHYYGGRRQAAQASHGALPRPAKSMVPAGPGR